MSKETLHHLNTNTLIGNTEHRGTAWHYRADLQGGELNHYPGPVPVEDVRRRLFHWSADSRPLAVALPADLATATHLGEDGALCRWTPVRDRQAIVRSDTEEVMGIFSTGYVMHPYEDWLLTTVANILDENLSISSAGLLKGGAIAWVEVSMPETVSSPEGLDFRPNLLATTSFDGSIATTYKRTVSAVVCDNTRAAALGERGRTYKVKHSRHSQARLAEARQALSVVHQMTEDYLTEISTLTRTPVSDRQWDRFLVQLIPASGPTGQPLTPRARRAAEEKKYQLNHLYRSDHRASPWQGTALGVLQAVNTWEHHYGTVRGATRSERNMLKAVKGDFDALDRQAFDQLRAAAV
jgi:phage/plasmid-like protein (TIGR03299 family)